MKHAAKTTIKVSNETADLLADILYAKQQNILREIAGEKNDGIKAFLVKKLALVNEALTAIPTR